MPLPAVTRTLLLLPDHGQTPLGEVGSGHLRQIVHSPYGYCAPTAEQASRVGFNGQLRERPGWYQLGNGHRIYNPILRRFHSPDRMSPFERGGLNAYSYCLGDPVNLIDPTGQSSEFLDFSSAWTVMKGVFYDRPWPNFILNLAIFSANLGAAVINPPAGIALYAARSALIGATLGMAGSLLQAQGEEDIGKPISLAGTAFAIGANFTRAGLGVRRIVQEWSTVRGDFGARVKNIFVGGYKPPSVKTSTASSPRGSITSSAADIPSRPPTAMSAGQGSLNSSNLPDLSSHGSSVSAVTALPGRASSTGSGLQSSAVKMRKIRHADRINLGHLNITS